VPAYEVNFDGLVGPTHNYAGLSYGNIASTTHRLSVSSPRQAALQGLAKMKYVAGLGLKQAVLPPQERPHLDTLRYLGFTGTDAQVLEKAAREDPALLASVCSSSSMWAANAATVSPGFDTGDARVHFTPANLLTQFHRSIEPPTTTAVLRAIFRDESAFTVHEPLPSAAHFSDEGAANHTRLAMTYDGPGVEVFTYGRCGFDPTRPAPRVFPARQTLETARALARRHLLDPERTLFYRQDHDAIDSGVFHNDVVAVGNRDVFFFHEKAIADKPHVLDQMRRAFEKGCGGELQLVEVSAAHVSLDDAISTYLFNSQLVTLPDGRTALIAPMECRENPRVHAFIADLLSRAGPIAAVNYVDVRQSMQNGGGPACLRLRVVLDDQQIARVHPGVMWSDQLERKLALSIEKHYRDSLMVDDLRDPFLMEESRQALDALCSVLDLPAIYSFQR
jgi:succinylarginine dihydrolase